MHAWKRVFALLATVTISNGLPASYAADVFPEFDYSPPAKLISLIPQEQERH